MFHLQKVKMKHLLPERKTKTKPNQTNQQTKTTMQQTSLTAVWQTAYLQLSRCKSTVRKQVYIAQNSFIK